MDHAVISALDTLEIILGGVALVGTNALWSWRWSREVLSVRGGWAYLRLIWFHRSARVRFSSSSLLLVPDGAGGYLMVRSKKPEETYWAPVGGVVKSYLSAQERLRSLQAVVDSRASTGLDLEHDLRVLLPARNLSKFLSWYMSEQGRESAEAAVFREMHEELADVQLPVDQFDPDKRAPVSLAYAARPVIGRDRKDPGTWHYRLFTTIALEPPVLNRLVDAARAHVHEDLAFVRHEHIDDRSFRGERVGWHADVLLCKEPTPPQDGI